VWGRRSTNQGAGKREETTKAKTMGRANGRKRRGCAETARGPGRARPAHGGPFSSHGSDAMQPRRAPRRGRRDGRGQLRRSRRHVPAFLAAFRSKLPMDGHLPWTRAGAAGPKCPRRLRRITAFQEPGTISVDEDLGEGRQSGGDCWPAEPKGPGQGLVGHRLARVTSRLIESA